jgi:hypothetical protein
MVIDEERTSIQVSVSIRNLLKEFCDENGFKMNRFVEKAILQAITGSYKISSTYENDKIPS